jgi:hypothetical protein
MILWIGGISFGQDRTIQIELDGEGLSRCYIGPDGFIIDYGTVAVGGSKTERGFVKNWGMARCMVESITTNDPLNEVEVTIPGLVGFDNLATPAVDEGLAEIAMKYIPADDGVDHFTVDIAWRTARYLDIQTVGDGTVAATIDGIWTADQEDRIVVPHDANGEGTDVNGIVTLAANPGVGSTFSFWTVTGIVVADTAVNPLVFNMPNNDVSAEAVFALTTP